MLPPGDVYGSFSSRGRKISSGVNVAAGVESRLVRISRAQFGARTHRGDGFAFGDAAVDGGDGVAEDDVAGGVIGAGAGGVGGG